MDATGNCLECLLTYFRAVGGFKRPAQGRANLVFLTISRYVIQNQFNGDQL